VKVVIKAAILHN